MPKDKLKARQPQTAAGEFVRAPKKRRGQRPSGTERKKRKQSRVAYLTEYIRRLNRHLDLKSHPLQDMMEVEDPTPAPALNGQPAGTSAAAAEAEPEITPAEDESAGDANKDKETEDAQRLNAAKVLSAVLEYAGEGRRANNASREPRIDMTKVINRPSTYDGISGRYHEWKNEIQIYLGVMNFPQNTEASVVLSYLRGTALNWWLQKTLKFQSDGIEVPQTWAELLPYLDERFEHRNPELAARDKLMNLKQNSLTLHQYLKEFEGCYAYITRWDEADKIHRFIYGLKPHYRSKFCVDPATHKGWISFDALVAYISSYVADDATPPEVIEDATGNLKRTLGLSGRGKFNKPGRSGKWQKQRLNAVLGKLSDSDRKVLNTVLKGRVTKKFGSVNQSASYTNANGESVTRNKHIRSYCHHQERPLCLGCYQPGHFVRDCTSPVANGTPEGYKAPAPR
jgi:hypothetical protein